MKGWPTKVLFFLMLAILMTAGRTDADLFDQERADQNILRAGRIDLLGQDTANRQDKSLLFQISGLVAQGFQVESLRISNDSTLPIEYTIVNQASAGDGLCLNLEITMLSNWQIIYQGPANSMEYSGSLDPEETQDFVLSLKLTSSDPSLQNNSCSFTTKVATTMSAQQSPFYDEEILQNQIVSGSW